jgi:hypothetical protein
LDLLAHVCHSGALVLGGSKLRDRFPETQVFFGVDVLEKLTESVSSDLYQFLR